MSKPTFNFLFACISTFLLFTCGGKTEFDNKKRIKDVKDIVAIITKIEGEVKLLRKNKQYTIVKKDIPLFEGDTLVSLNNSSMDIKFVGMGVSQLRPGSKITIKRMIKGKNISLEQNNGKSLFILKKLSKDQGFQIQTPTGIAGVRGTSFAIDSMEQSTKITVLTGKVALENESGNQVVSEKQSSIATKSKVSKPTKIDGVSLEDIKAMLYIEGAQEQADFEKMKENIKSLGIDIEKTIDDKIDLGNDFSAKKLGGDRANVNAKEIENEENLSSQSQKGAFGGDQDIMLKK